jgi:hypothetical protein
VLRFVDPSWRFQSTNFDSRELISSAGNGQGLIAYAAEQAGRRNITAGFTFENSNLMRYAGFRYFFRTQPLDP